MTDALTHRGPDGEGYFWTSVPDGVGRPTGVGLGSRRLAIIDRALGHQPIHNADSTRWIVFNGEIYNYQDQRARLAADGYPFYTRSDTEVVLALYERYGEDCVRHLRGMFAFAVWDGPAGRLFLARDRLGIKPLYYTETGGTFLFASELKGLLASGLVDRAVEPRALVEFLGFYHVPPPLTMLRGVRALPPGTHLTCAPDGGPRLTRYWEVPVPPPWPRATDEAALARSLRARVEESVRIHLMSEVPLGAFLSGGIDSSLLVGVMSRLLDRPVETFSVGFVEADRRYDETEYAELAARHFRTAHTRLTLSDTDVLAALPRVIWGMDQPSGDGVQSYFVSQAARSRVTVSLSGLGGDELFAGYSQFLTLPRAEQWDPVLRRIPAPVRRTALAALRRLPPAVRERTRARHLADLLYGAGDFARRYETTRTLLRSWERIRLLSPALRAGLDDAEASDSRVREALGARRDLDVIDRLTYLELTGYMPDMLLRDMDAMSMAHSLEVRVPLIDHQLVEFVTTGVPPWLRVRDGIQKYILLRAFHDLLPEPIRTRRKMGFELPMPRWLRGTLRPTVDRALARETVAKRGLLDPESVRELQRAFYGPRGGSVSYLRVWSLVVLELWCRLFLDRAGPGVESVTTADLVA
jgi:asparagine synthase (glutamine-hydrolysing)